MSSLLLVAILVLAIDQGSKACAQSGLSAFVSTLSRRRVVRPSGALPSRQTPWPLVGLWLATGAGVLLLAWFDPRLDGALARVSLGAALGGASGNVLDRLRNGAVVDFIDLRWWPVFNLADVAIVAGVALGLWAWARG